jgi:hypothetical protein
VAGSAVTFSTLGAQIRGCFRARLDGAHAGIAGQLDALEVELERANFDSAGDPDWRDLTASVASGARGTATLGMV